MGAPNADEGGLMAEPKAEDDDDDPNPAKAEAGGAEGGGGDATLAGVPAMLISPPELSLIIPSYGPSPCRLLTMFQPARTPSLV